MTRDELKALWAELGENHYNHRIGDYANEIPPGPPRPGFDAVRLEGAPGPRDARDPHPRREEAAAGQPPGLPAPGDDQRGLEPRGLQVHRDLSCHPRPRRPRRQDRASSCTPTRARCSTARTTRTGSSTTSTTWSTASTARSTRPTPYAADWISVGGEALFAPLNVLELVESRWGGHNPQVTEANVRSLDLANGGGCDRPARRRPADLPAGRPVRGRPPGADRQRLQASRRHQPRFGGWRSFAVSSAGAESTLLSSPARVDRSRGHENARTRSIAVFDPGPTRSPAIAQVGSEPGLSVDFRCSDSMRIGTARWILVFDPDRQSANPRAASPADCRECNGSLTQSIRQASGSVIFVTAVQV